MSVATFDTLKFANTLKAAGVPEKQAEAQAVAFAEVIQINFKDQATKGDLAATAKDVRQELKDVEQRLTARINDVEQSLTTKIKDVEQSLTAKIKDSEQCLTTKIKDSEDRWRDSRGKSANRASQRRTRSRSLDARRPRGWGGCRPDPFVLVPRARVIPAMNRTEVLDRLRNERQHLRECFGVSALGSRYLKAMWIYSSISIARLLSSTSSPCSNIWRPA